MNKPTTTVSAVNKKYIDPMKNATLLNCKENEGLQLYFFLLQYHYKSTPIQIYWTFYNKK